MTKEIVTISDATIGALTPLNAVELDSVVLVPPILPPNMFVDNSITETIAPNEFAPPKSWDSTRSSSLEDDGIRIRTEVVSFVRFEHRKDGGRAMTEIEVFMNSDVNDIVLTETDPFAARDPFRMRKNVFDTEFNKSSTAFIVSRVVLFFEFVEFLITMDNMPSEGAEVGCQLGCADGKDDG